MDCLQLIKLCKLLYKEFISHRIRNEDKEADTHTKGKHSIAGHNKVTITVCFVTTYSQVNGIIYVAPPQGLQWFAGLNVNASL